MNKCPKCGGDLVAGRDSGSMLVYECSSISWGREDFQQSDPCRIRELEAQLAAAREIAQKYEDRYFAANQRIQELTEWRPMESAPKDVPILTKMKHGVIEGVWDGEEARGYYFQDIGWYPKGWLPLPQ